MEAKALKDAVKKYGPLGLTAELADQLKKDGVSEEDSAAIMEAIKALPKKVERPNDNLNLSAFDYNELKGKSFIKYEELVNNLNGFENRDFVQYMASGEFETALDKHMDKYEKLIGIKINNVKPVNFTRIPVEMARNMNRQILDRNNPASNSRYYLLRQYEDKASK